jgi:hypothetical protein
MFSDKLPSPLSAPLPGFLPVLVFVPLYCTMHPSGSRASRFLSPWRRRVAKRRGLKYLEAKQPVLFPPTPPVRFCGPRKTSVPGRVQKRSTFMVGYQHRMAHGVGSKDRGLESMSGVERLTNQLTWLFQQKLGFPVPAQLDYRNILASSNST